MKIIYELDCFIFLLYHLADSDATYRFVDNNGRVAFEIENTIEVEEILNDYYNCKSNKVSYYVDYSYYLELKNILMRAIKKFEREKRKKR